MPPLSIRFQIVSVATTAHERTRIQLCGRLSVEIDRVQFASALRGRQVPLLLAYLVINRERAVGREELIDALWPQRAPVSQDAALRTLLSRVRTGLPPAVLSGRDELQLKLPEPAWVDLEAASRGLERARQALAGGEARAAWALAQVPLNITARGLLPGAQADWIEPHRRELHDVRLGALELLGRTGLRLGGGQLASAERAARSVIGLEPYRESAHLLLMQALAAQGNVPEALQAFERLRMLLREELGSTPSAQALSLHQRLLRGGGDVGSRPLAGEDPPDPSASRLALPPELAQRSARALVGRHQELAALQELWLGAQGGQRRPTEPRPLVVLLAGEPGVGKTRLMAELARMAYEAGAIVLAGRSPEESLTSYQPFIEAIRHYAAGSPVTELRNVAREHGPELARLIPELHRRLPELAPAPAGEPETERYRLFEAVVGLLTEIARAEPVLLVLDDLHWADRPTLLLLRHLARASASTPLLVLGSYRASELTADGLGETLSALRREDALTRIALDGLSESETAELIRAQAGAVPAAPLVRAVYAETEGSPLFVGEIVRQLCEQGVSIETAGAPELAAAGLPEGVREAIARRLARLDPGVIELLRTAAVIGRDFEARLLEEVVGPEADGFLAALERAIAASLLDEDPRHPGRYSFSHALIRETLYGGMSEPRRRRLHRSVGEALERRAAPPQQGERRQGEPRDLPALALHLTRAAGPQDAEKAIGYAMRAAEWATERLAHEEAAFHLERALEVQERLRPQDRARRLELLVALGEARVRAGERPLAWGTFREAAALASELSDDTALARSAIGASRRYVQPPGVVDEELIELLERALGRTRSERSVLRVALMARLCGALYYSERRARITQLAEQATTLAEELAQPLAYALAAAARRRANWDPARLEQRIADSTELLTRGREAGELELILQGHAWLVLDLLEQGNSEAVDAQIDAFSTGAEQLRQPLFLWNAAVWRAMRALLAGRLDEADRLAAEALSMGSHGENVTAPQYYAVQLLAIRREQRRMAELEGPARQLVATNPDRGAWRAGLMTLLWETGRPQEAAAELEHLARAGFEDIRRDGDWLTAITLLADGAAELGDRERAERLYELLLPYRSGNVVIGIATVCLGAAARHLGRLALTVGWREEAVAHLREAVIANTALRTPLYLAHAQLDLARALGAGEEAEGLAQAAAQAAARLDLPAVAERARQLRLG